MFRTLNAPAATLYPFVELLPAVKGNVNAGHTMTKRHGVGCDKVGFYHSLEPDSIYQENDPRFQFVNPLVNPNMLTDF